MLSLDEFCLGGVLRLTPDADATSFPTGDVTCYLWERIHAQCLPQLEKLERLEKLEKLEKLKLQSPIETMYPSPLHRALV